MRVDALARPNRETVTTIQADGSRRFLHPSDSRGPFTRARRLSAFALISLYVVLPWVHIGGHPAVFLDVAARRFHLFGWTLVAEDLWLMFFLVSGLGFSLFLVTALFGRVWCGWACPQTVFLEHVFRRIERWVEGDAPRRRALAQAAWSGEKILKRMIKHGAFLLVSALIAHVLLSYFVSIPALWRMMRGIDGHHWTAFLSVLAVTFVLYFNFAWFREQLCIVICPYGRLQSALIDEHSLVIGYDARRGEPRGKFGSTGAGDCVDCNRCVQVCPTGIDIRQGLQMECIGCTACIDACDQVMAKLKRPVGLIRYDSHEGFAGRNTRWLRPRLALYASLLALGAAVTAVSASRIQTAAITMTRLPGAPYFVNDEYIRNQFMLRVINKEDRTAVFDLGALNLEPPVVVSGLDAPMKIAPMAEQLRPIIVRVPRSGYLHPFTISFSVVEVSSGTRLTREMQFLGPDRPTSSSAAK